ncbi:MAG: DegV family protein [Chloroflexi bacterium]|nr:DegV family protein [Chloroflexota bacterium]
MAVKVVTDSTADLPEEIVKDLDVTVVPLLVLFGQETYKDGVEITREEFFNRLVNGMVLPRTSQPSVGDFVEVYKKLTEQGHEIVSVHVSEKLSGTLNSARLAAEQVPGAKIEIDDSATAALGLGLVAKATAEAAQEGKSQAEVAAFAREASGKTDVFFVVETLEYLQKGGRIGKAQALIGGLLSIKPILTVKDGEVHPHEKVRTRAKAVAKLCEIAEQNAPYAEVGIIHEAQGEAVDTLLDRLKPLSSKPVTASKIGAVVGVYTGPGVIGVALRKA